MPIGIPEELLAPDQVVQDNAYGILIGIAIAAWIGWQVFKFWWDNKKSPAATAAKRSSDPNAVNKALLDVAQQLREKTRGPDLLPAVQKMEENTTKCSELLEKVVRHQGNHSYILERIVEKVNGIGNFVEKTDDGGSPLIYNSKVIDKVEDIEKDIERLLREHDG
jgi:hypothetical protein